eukprot:TRINITY_DN17987_c0_g1_i1.p1 TRINITY_DN17987_c0_g1~~TRINITY_DN17987_c0_g1_i1.p1  ORF type:complete len:118 (+),score=15.14 TRINITY_DN17987_c0_g1_i1:64-417(+)
MCIRDSKYSMNVEEDPQEHLELVRFQQELEFVQFLANPSYLKYLSDEGYFEQRAFRAYLKYLTYWKQWPYIRFIRYPVCLKVLEILTENEGRLIEKLSDKHFLEHLENSIHLSWEKL